MARNALLVEIDDDDIAWAIKQNRYNCAIVRAIQRKLPQALRVTADEKTIRFTLPEEDVRYTFETPRAVVSNVIRKFDLGQELDPDDLTFTLSTAIAREPVQHRSAADRATQRQQKRRNRPQSKSPQVHNYGRFMDEQAEEATG